ncbi:MAG TPA: sulfite reductase subunit alpha, partial [Opitutales bacterium]|nr:sulfite reductase subunit alpha [Opitutales bacterium]
MVVATQVVHYTKDNPFITSITESRLLSKPGSEKETRHFCVDLAGSGIEYSVGDSIGIYPVNDQGAVEQLLKMLGATGEEEVELPRMKEKVSLRQALISHLSLANPNPKTLEAFLERATDEKERAELEALLQPEARAETREFLANREFVDLLEEFPSARFEPQEFVGLLRRLMPRLYSVASSPHVHPEEVHLTVAVIRYSSNQRERIGVCSTCLSDRFPLHEKIVPVFVAPSRFGLPEDESVDIIMVGPGTGVAPFRGFLQEREAKRSSGRNWLFFGEQRRESDFLYQEDFEKFLENGTLARLDLAFSRDQAEKIYVQDRMREQGEELWKWIEKGAYFYVCGDAKRMAKDVDTALRE